VAELSVEESQRLSRLFLTGLASESDVSRLAAAMPEDQTLALELLAQIQTALDDVAPEGLSKEQAQSVASRVEALVTPRVKRRGLFGMLKRLFRGRPKQAKPEAAAEPVVEKAPVAAPLPASTPEPSPALDAGDGMEEMAPIAPGDGPSGPPPLPADALPEPLGAGSDRALPATPAAPGRWRLAAMAAAAIVALLLLAAAVRAFQHRAQAKALAAAPPPTPVAAKPTPPPMPRPAGAIRRERAVAVPRNEPLPAAIPPTTPQASGQLPF
jgi:hypothetical protein